MAYDENTKIEPQFITVIYMLSYLGTSYTLMTNMTDHILP